VSPSTLDDPGTVLAASVVDEWATVVAGAIVGTERRPLPPAAVGWGAWSRAGDPAVALLDRASALVIARRAGISPGPVPDVEIGIAPHDPRPTCVPAVAIRLQRMLRGEHDLLLPEWFACIDAARMQLPWASLPRLLLLARNHPEMDRVVRRLAQGRAEWLIDAVPELGVARVGRRPAATDPSFEAPRAPADSAVAVGRLIEQFRAGLATWASAPQLRVVVASLDPVWLPTVVTDLSRIGFDPHLERTRAELVALAEFRHAMLAEFAAALAGALPIDPRSEEST
jgi:hypothetical protein